MLGYLDLEMQHDLELSNGLECVRVLIHTSSKSSSKIWLKFQDFVTRGWYECKKVILGLRDESNDESVSKMRFLGSGKHSSAFSVIFNEIGLEFQDFATGGYYQCRKVILGLGDKSNDESVSKIGFLGSRKHSSNFSSENSSKF